MGSSNHRNWKDCLAGDKSNDLDRQMAKGDAQALNFAVLETGRLDILVRERDGGRGRSRHTRPWLTFLLNAHSGALLGAHIDPDRLESAMACLAIVRRANGLPPRILVDGAFDFDSRALVQACEGSEIALFLGRSRPALSGLVERWFRYLNEGMSSAQEYTGNGKFPKIYQTAEQFAELLQRLIERGPRRSTPPTVENHRRCQLVPRSLDATPLLRSRRIDKRRGQG